MSWVGLIKCPDCELPIESEAQVCPYCYSTAPARAPWKGRWSDFGLIAIAVAGVLLTAWLCDYALGTEFVTHLKSVFMAHED